jgi:hypothetical protein
MRFTKSGGHHRAQVTASVVGALELEQIEIERAKRKPIDSLDAYDCYLRALANF